MPIHNPIIYGRLYTLVICRSHCNHTKTPLSDRIRGFFFFWLPEWGKGRTIGAPMPRRKWPLENWFASREKIPGTDIATVSTVPLKPINWYPVRRQHNAHFAWYSRVLLICLSLCYVLCSMVNGFLEPVPVVAPHSRQKKKKKRTHSQAHSKWIWMMTWVCVKGKNTVPISGCAQTIHLASPHIKYKSLFHGNFLYAVMQLHRHRHEYVYLWDYFFFSFRKNVKKWLKSFFLDLKIWNNVSDSHNFIVSICGGHRLFRNGHYIFSLGICNLVQSTSILAANDYVLRKIGLRLL